MADDRDDILQVLFERHADLTTHDALEAAGIEPELLIDAAASLLHQHRGAEPVIHKLCSDGVAKLLKLCLCVGVEVGIRSCAGFKKPN
jgi:hypothetical protein